MKNLKMTKNTTWLDKSGYTQQQQEEIYNETLSYVYDNASYVLDNLDYLPEYRVYFGNYTNSSNGGWITPNSDRFIQKVQEKEKDL